MSAKKLTVGSLFSGIGGFDLGLERAGMEIVWQSEIDAYASAVLRKHWPDVPNLGDIRNIRNPPTVDVLCGGFPCQDISLAGKGAGIEGERSGLWREYARIIGEVRPRFVLVENVAALLGRGLGRVLGDLAALGFDAEWHCIPASAVGAPHRRDRLWIIGYANNQGEPVVTVDDEAPGMPQFDVAYAAGDRWGQGGEDVCGRSEGIGPRQELGLGDGGEALADAFGYGLQGRGEPGEGKQAGGRVFAGREIGGALGRVRSGECCWPTEPDVGRVAHGVPARLDRLRALGNAIVPQIAEILGRAIVSAA